MLLSRSPDAQHLRSLSRRLDLRVPDETLDVRDGADCSGDEPRQADDRADDEQGGDHKKIKMIPVTFLSAER